MSYDTICVNNESSHMWEYSDVAFLYPFPRWFLLETTFSVCTFTE